MISTNASPRPRVLMIACACSPNHGSEWCNGWNRALESAKHFDTWVICQGDEQEQEIIAYLKRHGPIAGLQFSFVHYPVRQKHPAHVKGLGWLAYNIWNRQAYRLARRLDEQYHFDLIHQVTVSGFREPGYAWKLAAPFIWGPIGGTHNYPWRFVTESGLRQGWRDALRNVTNRVQLYTNLRTRRAAHKSAALLVANSTTQAEFRRVTGLCGQVMLDVGIQKVSPAPRPPRLAGSPLRILWSGQFVQRKALSLLLRALANIPADVAWELRVVGDGPLAGRWKQLAGQLGLEQHVQWLGWLPHDQAQAQCRWADVFAFTSLRDNSGTVVLEAMGAGVPIVCFDHQGVHDMVTDDCGIKLPLTNPRQAVLDLGDAVAKLAGDAATLERMSRAAIERAERYQWPELGRQMIEVYRRVLDLDEGSGRVPHRAAPAAEGRQDSIKARARELVRATAGWTAGRASAGLNATFGARCDGAFGILMYHRVADRVRGVPSPTWNVTPRMLREQLAGLLARGYQAWPLSKLIAAHRSGLPVPPKTFAVTFDDGYANNFLSALPILRELRVPATISLATGYLDSAQSFPFDDWSATGSKGVPACAWRPLTMAECQELHRSGLVDLGAHTHTHQNFSGRPEEFRRDLSRSVDVLRDHFGITHPTFAFPFGITSPELVAAARRCGVSCAVTTEAQPVYPHDDPFTWGRFGVAPYDTGATLAAKLSGWRLSRSLLTRSRPARPIDSASVLEALLVPDSALDASRVENNVSEPADEREPVLRGRS